MISKVSFTRMYHFKINDNLEEHSMSNNVLEVISPITYKVLSEKLDWEQV